MPEGPEIRLAADKIEAALHDRELTEVFFAFDHLKPYSRSLAGSKVLAVETRGKALLIHTNCGLSIYSHNQLYGRWMTRKAGSMPKTSRQLRLALHNHDYSAYLFSASDISVLATGQQAQHPFLARLGPDIMSAPLADVRRQIKDPPFFQAPPGAAAAGPGLSCGHGQLPAQRKSPCCRHTSGQAANRLRRRGTGPPGLQHPQACPAILPAKGDYQ